jgi:surfeit locus 1 family protein
VSQWQLSLLFLLFLPLLLRLGYWQLERAEEKQQMLTVYQQQRNLPVQKFSFQSTEEIVDYQPILLEGEYLHQYYWLLDNKPRSGKVGYEIIMPLKVDKTIVLVNRGWILAPRLRGQLPEITTPKGKVSIQGYFHQASKNAVFLNKESDWLEAWPKRVLQLDTVTAGQDLQDKVHSKILRINDNSEGAFITDWPVINTLPEKHHGYAVQWFAMAIALFFLYFWALFKRESK